MLSKDIVLDVPKIVLWGRKELLIENHRGIMECSEQRICINLARGFIELRGQELQIKSLSADEIQIVGCLEQIQFWE